MKSSIDKILSVNETMYESRYVPIISINKDNKYRRCIIYTKKFPPLFRARNNRFDHKFVLYVTALTILNFHLPLNMFLLSIIIFPATFYSKQSHLKLRYLKFTTIPLIFIRYSNKYLIIIMFCTLTIVHSLFKGGSSR